MSFIKKALFGLSITLLLFIGIGFILPSEWQVERSITIQASPEKMYPFVANFQTGWPQWSAFDAEYSDCVYSYAGPMEGVGAIRSWTSEKMGNGFQEIVQADPAKGIKFELTMLNYGTKMTGAIEFSSAITGETLVRWIDTGNMGYNPVMRWMGLFMGSMLGQMLEKSLINLKQLVESN